MELYPRTSTAEWAYGAFSATEHCQALALQSYLACLIADVLINNAPVFSKLSQELVPFSQYLMFNQERITKGFATVDSDAFSNYPADKMYGKINGFRLAQLDWQSWVIQQDR